MDKEKMLDNIVFLPRQFNTDRNISVYNLLKRSGYFDFANDISTNDIKNAINKRPDVVEDWLNWSENKRVSQGWFFKNDSEKYIVDYFPYKTNVKRSAISDAYEACAIFIKNEIEDIRNI